MTGSRPTRPLGDMATEPHSTGTGSFGGRARWTGWMTGQADDGRASGNTPSSPFDDEHPMKKYRRRNRKKTGGRRRSGPRSRNNRIRGRRVLEVTTTTAATTTASPSNQVDFVLYFTPGNHARYSPASLSFLLLFTGLLIFVNCFTYLDFCWKNSILSIIAWRTDSLALYFSSSYDTFRNTKEISAIVSYPSL